MNNKEVVFTISLNARRFDIITKHLMFVELNRYDIMLSSLYDEMHQICIKVAQEGYGCLFEVD